ncbi:MAG: dithiol-disulfide isomerase [Rhodospirillaceae bacterium]|nr:dithiol-disulfide isomerase [Rhodospirillaceae bacterium]|tara:strand:- start:2482 stop:3120 length:639 start_codon:yes stop_codon:yes gene_type:complete
MILDIFSDPVCPWCYIGKRRLERTLDDIPPDRQPHIRWRAFMLNPDMPSDGMELNAYLSLKFGSSQRAMELYDTIARAGYEEDILFAFGDIYRTPSTVLAHRLIGWAGEHGVQTTLVEEIFQAYFLKGVDIGDVDNLVELAAKAGLTSDEVLAFLETDEGSDTVLAEHNLAQRMGINGVPCFILDGRYAVSGAQSPEVLQRMIESARETSAA